jgi:hypothetical protein
VDDVLEAATRCPHCRASVRPGAPWCTLCHADLRPAPAPAPETEPAPALVAPSRPQLDPLTAPAVALGLPNRNEPTWPCSTCGATNPIAADACVACGAGFLAGLREAEGPLLELPGIGDLTRMSRVQRMMIAFGVVLAVVALVALVGLLAS